MSTRLGHSDYRLLSNLDINGGWTSGQIARAMGYTNIRMEAQLLRRDLLRLETLGLVARIDDQSPAAWIRTNAGTEAMNV